MERQLQTYQCTNITDDRTSSCKMSTAIGACTSAELKEGPRGKGGLGVKEGGMGEGGEAL